MKSNLTLPKLALSAAVLTTGLGCIAQTTLVRSAEAQIRSGIYADMDWATLLTTVNNGSSSQYSIEAKYGTVPGDTSRKSYFQFDLSGANANTNSAATFTIFLNTAVASHQNRLRLWALNQAYPDLGNNPGSLKWNTAAANDTASNEMLTNGSPSATALADVMVPNRTSATSTNFQIPAPWGQYVFNNTLTIALTGVNDAANGSSPVRMLTNSSSLTIATLVGGNPPSISTVPNITVMTGQASTNAQFTVSDPEDGVPTGALSAVFSSNETVVPSASVWFSGSGANRSVNVNPAGAPGTALVTIQILDSNGNAAQRTFAVTVVPLNYPPAISAIPPTNTLLNAAVTVPFTVGDVETPASGLTVNGSIATYSAGILASLAFAADASGTNGTVTVTPVTGATGVGVVTVSVSDPNGNTASSSFAVMVRPNAGVVLIENFDYLLNANILKDSGGLWVLCNPLSQSIQLRMANEIGAEGKLWIRSRGSADDCAARLVGAPYNPGSGAVLYTKLAANWVDYAGLGNNAATNAVRSGTNVNGPFLQLLNTASTTSAAVSSVGLATNDVATGYFRLGLTDYSGQFAFLTGPAATLPWSGSSANIVTRYDVDAGRSTLWVNAASEGSPHVSVLDDLTPGAISYAEIRQDLGMGDIYVDSLQVMFVRKPTITSISQPSGGNVTLSFSTGQDDAPSNFAVERAGSITGTFEDVTDGISGSAGNYTATVAAPASPSFYRVKRKPMSF